MTTGSRPRRTDGYVPIADYGILGDGRTAALVATDGRVDWWPLPDLDALPAFAAVLDPASGGCLELQPDEAFSVRRRYVGDTNVLETTFSTGHGRVRVTDALTVGRAGPLPWTELVRRIEGLDGEVAMSWSVRPGTRFGTVQPWSSVRTQWCSRRGGHHFAAGTHRG